MALRIVAAVLLFLTACPSLKTGIQPSKELILATSIPFGGLDPFSSRSGIGANILELLYRPLFQIGENGEIIPDYAKEVTLHSQSNKDLFVVLKDASADDVKDSIEKAKKIFGGDLYEGLRNLDSIEVRSPSELIFHLEKFDRAFLILLSQIPIVAFSKNNAGTGEFVIRETKPDEIVLERKIKSNHQVNILRIKVIPSPRRALRELVAGNVDILFFVRESDYEVLQDLPEIQVGQLKSRMLYQVLENRAEDPKGSEIDWIHVRQKIDPNVFLPEAKDEKLVLPVIPVPMEDKWYPQKPIELTLQKRNLDETRERKKRKLTFLGEQARDRRIARILKRNFEEAGFSLDLTNLSPAEFSKVVFLERNFDLVLLPYNVKDVLMSNYLVFHEPEGSNNLNYSRYVNESVNTNLEAARYNQKDLEAKTYFAKAMQSIADDPPGLFLFWLNTPIVYRKSCSGFKFSTGEFFSSLKDVRCEPSGQN